jgi:hypothetical protein
MGMVNINGVATEVPAGAVAYKYADPTEGARWITDRREAEGIIADDPSLIVWASADFHPTHTLDGVPVQVIDEGTEDGSSGVYTIADVARSAWPAARVRKDGVWIEGASWESNDLAAEIAPGRIAKVQ